MTDKTDALRRLLTSDDLGFLMEAHNGLSAKVAEEAGFEALWGSGLSISASMGVRDNNEMSWTQVLDIVEFISDAVRIPLLLDGDTGYGNFNNMRRLVEKLESRDIAGVCIEDKLFPKTNSFIGDNQPLADMDEFCGKIKAGKDAQRDDSFTIVARVEALIAGWGIREAIRRAEAYRESGADAILIHSKMSKPDEILEFMDEWGDRAPVVIVPTTYYATPTQAFRDAGVSAVIWANHLMRSAMTAMRQTAQQIHEEESLINIEDRIVTVKDVFQMQGASELAEAERRYLPAREDAPKALILAAGRGAELGVLTEDRPKAMVEIAGKPLIVRTIETFDMIGVRDVTIVRGYRKDALDLSGVAYVDNDDHATTQEAYSLIKGLEATSGPVIVAYGDVLFQKFIPMSLLESGGDFVIPVDPTSAQGAGAKGRYRDLVTGARAFERGAFDERTTLVKMGPDLPDAETHGEWMGLLSMTHAGVQRLLALASATDPEVMRTMRMADVFAMLVADGQRIEVAYVRGHWLDVDDVQDVVAASNFGGAGTYQ